MVKQCKQSSKYKKIALEVEGDVWSWLAEQAFHEHRSVSGQIRHLITGLMKADQGAVNDSHQKLG